MNGARTGLKRVWRRLRRFAHLVVRTFVVVWVVFFLASTGSLFDVVQMLRLFP